jgi:hypothetical protein
LGVDRSGLRLTLPVVDLPATAHEFMPGRGPSDDEAEGVEWRFEHDVLARETRAYTRYGGTYDGVHGAVTTDDYQGAVGVSTVDPARAWARGTSSFEIEWPEARVRSEATLAVVSDADTFDVTIELRVTDAGEEIAHRTWHRTLSR